MMNELKLPPYLKYITILFGVVLLIFVMIIAKGLLIPIAIAFILALLLHPVCTRLERLKLPRGAAVIISIILVFAILGAIFYFMSSQIGKISADLADIDKKLADLLSRTQQFLADQFGVTETAQAQYFNDSLNAFLSNSTAYLTSTLSATAGFFANFVVVLLTLFFFLYYSNFFKQFLYRVVSTKRHDKLNKILSKVELVAQDYITGLFTVMAIVAVLNTLGLFIIGIKYALFFGLLAAFLTIIPYIGIFIGSFLPMAFALVTKDSMWYVVAVAAVFWAVQFIEGNFITPNVIGNKVSINPFAAILALFIGAEVWGAAGMILFIPYLAILKVLCDAVEPLQSFGFLLGDPHMADKKYVFKNIRVRPKKSV